MSTYDEAKEPEQRLKKNIAFVANPGRDATTEASDTKENIVGLMRNAEDPSSDKARALTNYLRARLSELMASGENSLEKIEVRIRSKPGQSVAIAFSVGMLASYILGRRLS